MGIEEEEEEGCGGVDRVVFFMGFSAGRGWEDSRIIYNESNDGETQRGESRSMTRSSHHFYCYLFYSVLLYC